MSKRLAFAALTLAACGTLTAPPDSPADGGSAADAGVDGTVLEGGGDEERPAACPTGWICTSFDDAVGGPFFGWKPQGSDAATSLTLVTDSFSAPYSLAALSAAGQAYLERTAAAAFPSLVVTFALRMQKLPSTATIHPLEIHCDDNGVGTIATVKVKPDGTIQVSDSSGNDRDLSVLPQPSAIQWRPVRLDLVDVTGSTAKVTLTMTDTNETLAPPIPIKTCKSPLDVRIGALYASQVDATVLLDDVRFGPSL